MNNKVFKKALLSERIMFDNSSDENRKCDISAIVTMEGGKAKQVESGVVAKLPEETGAESTSPMAARIASFNRYHGSRLNVTFYDWEGHDNSEVLLEVEAFIEQCELNAANQ